MISVVTLSRKLEIACEVVYRNETDLLLPRVVTDNEAGHIFVCHKVLL